jgi:hypothetical protein
MPQRISDTSPEIDRIQIELIRALPSWRKFQMISEMILTTRKLALAGLQKRFPQATPGELNRHLATMLLGPELATKVYGPEPDPPTAR